MPGKKTILLIEDDASFLHKWTRLLEPRGYEIIAFENADLALNYLNYNSVTSAIEKDDLPYAVLTDNETSSRYRGSDVAHAILNAGDIGIVMISSDQPTRPELEAAMRRGMLFLDKLDNPGIDDVVEAIEYSAQQAMLKKLDIRPDESRRRRG